MNLKNTKSVEKTIPLADVARWMEVTDPLQKNVRKPEAYNRPDQVESIREMGLTDPIWVVKADAGAVSNPARKYIPLKGFSRRESLETLVNEYPQGYQYDGKNVRHFHEVRVKIVDTTDPFTRILLKLDHGDHRGLGKVELFNSFEQMYMLQATEKDIAVRLSGSLENNYPPDKKLPEAPSLTLPDGSLKPADQFKKEYDAYATARLKHFKGIIQQYKLIAQAPQILRDVCLQKLDGTKKWPTNEELRDGMRIYEDEIGQDTSGMLSKDNPGPAFKKWFDDTAKVKAEAESNGTLRGKTTAMMNAQQVREVLKQLTDPSLRRLVQILLRQVPLSALNILNATTVARPLNDEQKAILAGMQETTPTEEESKEEEAPAEGDDAKEEIPV